LSHRLFRVIHRTPATANPKGRPVTSELSAQDATRLLDDLTAIVARASAKIIAIAAGGVTTRHKADGSPVTAADEASEEIILDGHAHVLPGLPVIAEEMAGRRALAEPRGTFLMADPLDGTKEFLAGSDEFTVNLAIISRGTPLAGVVAAPKRGFVWRGVLGYGAERLRLTPDRADKTEPVRTRRWPARGAVAVMSRSHLDAATETFLTGLGPVERKPSGSAIKFCQLAEGAADVHPRLATVCEWDVAAGQALLTAAGGAVTTPDGRPVAYGRAAENFRVPSFIAWGDAAKAKST
jgi:3'(2'), 5'-bisphosphate nucleotidase